MYTLSELHKRGLDTFKETHPSKPYHLHVRECCEFVSKLMRGVYSYPEELVKFALLFSELHDVGKLLPEWSLDCERRPYHAIEGAEWLLRGGIELPISSPYREILIYAIITHHSMLYVPIEAENIVGRAESLKSRDFKGGYSRCKTLVKRYLNDCVKGLERAIRLDLADAIGIVKIADIISARGLSPEDVLMQYNWPEGLEERIIEGIVRRTRDRRGFDESKFEKQKRIASCKGRHLLLAAPTGWGKTALALIRMTKLKPAKVFYILPTITAIKDFYETFASIIDKAYIGEYFYFADVELLRRREFEGDELFDVLDVYRYFIPKITLTTIDQLLLTMLQVGKYHVRRFNLRNSLLIFDEFHLLTPQMVACLMTSLERLLSHYDMSCLFMSATPSPVYEELFRKVIPDLELVILNDEYRRLSRHRIEYCCDETIEDIITKNRDLLRKERTLIIANTVGKAQRIYLDLKKDLGDSRSIVLIHGDFAYDDRSEKEEQVSKADILVSTQVAEVSLDISFDLLITELSPIPSLVQRFGRVNRYGAEPSKINVFICKPEDDKPYGRLQMDLAHKNFPTLLESLERKGEEAYLDDTFWQYERLYMDDVERKKQEIAEEIDNIMLNFFSFKIKEENFSRILGREETYLAVPDVYLHEVLNLREKLKNVKNYSERKGVYGRIKGYLAPVLRSDIKFGRAEFREDLGLYVIRGYDREIGIRRI